MYLLIFGALTVGIVAGQNVGDVLDSFGKGFGDTATSVGILIALGAMFAKLLADSGGADEIVDTIVGHASPRALPWAMALVGAIIGLPMFFEIGLVLLMPVIYLVAKRSQLSLITVGIPALAGLSAMHGFVPPHPATHAGGPRLAVRRYRLVGQPVLDVGGQGPRRGIAALRRAGHRLQADRLQGRRDPGVGPPRRGEVAGPDRLQDPLDVRAAEGRPARRQYRVAPRL